MLSIRLSRTGKKKQPHFRVVVMEKGRDPWGKVIEILGHRNPRSKEAVLKADRIKHWISKGAQATDSVWNILVDEKVVEGKKRNITHISKKRTGKLEEKVAANEEKAEAAKQKAADDAAAAKEAEESAKAAEAEAKVAAKVAEEEAKVKAAEDAEAAKAAPAEEAPAEATTESSTEEAPEAGTDEAPEATEAPTETETPADTLVEETPVAAEETPTPKAE